MSELKLCPFCGQGDIEMDYDLYDGCCEHYVVCNNCAARGEWFSDHGADPKQKAIDAWNRRAE